MEYNEHLYHISFVLFRDMLSNTCRIFLIFCFPSFRHNKILKITEKFFSCSYFLQKTKHKKKGSVGIDRVSMIDLLLLKFFDRHLTRFILKWIAFFNR